MTGVRQLRLALGLALTLASIWVAALAAPTVVSACTCQRIDNPDIAKVAANPDYVVFIGTVTAIDRPFEGQNRRSLGDVRVERVFKGTMPAVARIEDGGGGDCALPLTIGRQMLWVAPYRNKVLEPFLCGLNAATSTPEGRTLIAAAEIAFGPGAFLEPPPGGPPIARVGTPRADAALPIALGAALAGVLALFGGVVILTGWRRSP
jgi:hypothetical protein